jgi:predicted nucleic acid-binding protein
VIVVSNTSLLIVLSKVDLCDLPQHLFNEIIISQEVWDEIVINGAGLPGSTEAEQADRIHVTQLRKSITFMCTFKSAEVPVKRG